MVQKVNPSPTFTTFNGTTGGVAPWSNTLTSQLSNEFSYTNNRLNAMLAADGSEAATAPIRLATYTFATLPSATLYPRGLAFVSDENENRHLVISDGTNWRYAAGHLADKTTTSGAISNYLINYKATSGTVTDHYWYFTNASSVQYLGIQERKAQLTATAGAENCGIQWYVTENGTFHQIMSLNNSSLGVIGVGQSATFYLYAPGGNVGDFVDLTNIFVNGSAVGYNGSILRVAQLVKTAGAETAQMQFFITGAGSLGLAATLDKALLTLAGGLTMAGKLSGFNGNTFTDLTEDTAPDPAADFLMTWDVSASAFKKVKPQRLSVGFAAHKNGTDQTGVANITHTKVTFTTELFDVGGYYDAGNSKWTPPAGLVQLSLTLYMQGMDATGLVQPEIYKNGAILKAAVNYQSRADGGGTITIVDQANGTDYYEAYVVTSTATTATVYGAQITHSHFSGKML